VGARIIKKLLGLSGMIFVSQRRKEGWGLGD